MSGARVRAQAVLYHNDPSHILCAVDYLNAAAKFAKSRGSLSSLDVAYGDSTPTAIFPSGIENSPKAYRDIDSLEFRFFNANMGSARGQNELMSGAIYDAVFIMNPDVLVAPNVFHDLLQALSGDQVGIAEARQLPLEHPKDYDVLTGEVSWASGACSLVRSEVIERTGGFDPDTFFLYCDDVDLSWRTRLAGYRIVHVPQASVFHSKRLSPTAEMQPSAAERYYSAEAALMMAYKYSRPDILREHLSNFTHSKDPDLLKAAGVFERKRKDGTLPSPIDPTGSAAQFIEGNYAVHRFAV